MNWRTPVLPYLFAAALFTLAVIYSRVYLEPRLSTDTHERALPQCPPTVPRLPSPKVMM